MFPGKSPQSVICGLALVALLALPALSARADGDPAPSLWEVLIGALEQLLEEEDPEAGLSHEPGG